MSNRPLLAANLSQKEANSWESRLFAALVLPLALCACSKEQKATNEQTLGTVSSLGTQPVTNQTSNFSAKDRLISSFNLTETNQIYQLWRSYLEPNGQRRSQYLDYLITQFGSEEAKAGETGQAQNFVFSRKLSPEVSAGFIKGGQDDLGKLEVLITGCLSVLQGRKYENARDLFQLSHWLMQDVLSDNAYRQLLIDSLATTNCVANSLTYAASVATIIGTQGKATSLKAYYVVGGLRQPHYPEGTGHAMLILGEGERFIDPSAEKDGKPFTIVNESAPDCFFPIVAFPFTITVDGNNQIAIVRDLPETWSVPREF